MAKFTVGHLLEIGEDAFWQNIFFDEEFNRRLYIDELGFSLFETVELTDEADGTKRRHVRARPPMEAPGPVKALVGTSLVYDEKGRFDPKTKRYVFEIEPEGLRDKIAIRGEFWVETRGPKQVERFCVTDCQVRVFGLGRVVEQLVEKKTREDYDRAARFTNRFIRERGF